MPTQTASTRPRFRHATAADYEPSVRLSYTQYATWPESGKRYELIDGIAYAMTAAPRFFHQFIVGELFAHLRAWVRETRSGEVGVAPIDVILDAGGKEETVVQPDVLFVAEVGPGRVTERGVDGPPTLVAEVLSPSTRAHDADLKRQVYEYFGVAELWLVDPEARTVEVLRREGEAFAEAGVLGEDAVLTSPNLPGFEAEVGALFRR